VDQEAVMLKQFSQDQVKKDFMNVFSMLHKSKDFSELLNNCVTVLSLNYK